MYLVLGRPVCFFSPGRHRSDLLDAELGAGEGTPAGGPSPRDRARRHGQRVKGRCGGDGARWGLCAADGSSGRRKKNQIKGPWRVSAPCFRGPSLERRDSRGILIAGGRGDAVASSGPRRASSPSTQFYNAVRAPDAVTIRFAVVLERPNDGVVAQQLETAQDERKMLRRVREQRSRRSGVHPRVFEEAHAMVITRITSARLSDDYFWNYIP